MQSSFQAKADGFVPGGASLHSCMTPHGPDTKTYEVIYLLAAQKEIQSLFGMLVSFYFHNYAFSELFYELELFKFFDDVLLLLLYIDLFLIILYRRQLHLEMKQGLVELLILLPSCSSHVWFLESADGHLNLPTWIMIITNVGLV